MTYCKIFATSVTTFLTLCVYDRFFRYPITAELALDDNGVPISCEYHFIGISYSDVDHHRLLTRGKEIIDEYNKFKNNCKCGIV